MKKILDKDVEEAIKTIEVKTIEEHLIIKTFKIIFQTIHLIIINYL